VVVPVAVASAADEGDSSRLFPHCGLDPQSPARNTDEIPDQVRDEGLRLNDSPLGRQSIGGGVSPRFNDSPLGREKIGGDVNPRS